MDLGIWATWYDLEDADRSRFLDWLHGDHLPELQRRPGYAWAAHYESEGGGDAMRHVRERIVANPDDPDVGRGSQFLMLVGAATPQTFFTPSVLELERDAPKATRDMLALRKEVRTGVFAEQTRMNGPAARERAPGSTPGPVIQMGSFRVRTVEEEFDLGCWYAQYRLPHMAQMPGCINTRKLLCVAGWAKHSVMYEFASLEARMQNFEAPHESHALDPKEWTGRVVRYTVHAPGSPTVGVRLWPPVEA